MKTGKAFFKFAGILTLGLLSTITTAALAGTLINPVTLTVRSLSPDIQLENLQVEYSTLCRYESGLIFPEDKMCGSSTVIVPVSAEGVIHLPGLDKFSGLHASDSSNYEISLSLEPKNRGPRDQTYYFALTTYNNQAVQALENLRDVIYIGHINGTTLNITAEHQPVVGGDLSRLPNVNLLVSVSIVSGVKESVATPILSSQFSNDLLGFENRVNGNGTVVTDLKNLKTVNVSGGNFAFIGSPANAKIYLDVTLSETVNYVSKVIYKKSIESQITADFLTENQNVDLEKVTN